MNSGARVAAPRQADFVRPSRWVLAVLLLGLALRTVQYLGQVDPWHDELAVIRNVVDRGPLDLVGRPLDHQQVAPAGFLLAIKACTSLLGTSTLSLRLVPWISSLAGMLLLWRVVARFASGKGVVVCLALFAVSPTFVRYGLSVKPYGSDVTLSLLIVWLALRHLERPHDLSRAVVAGLGGGLAILSSFPTVPTAAIVGSLLAARWWRHVPRPPAGPLVALAAGWGIGAALAMAYAYGQLDAQTDAFMRQFWAEDFPPTGSIAEAVVWTIERTWLVLAHALVAGPPSNPVFVVLVGIPAALAALGVILGLRRQRKVVVFLLAPLLAAWGTVLTGVLPFDGRLGIHAMWPILALVALAMTEVEGSGGRRRWILALQVLAAVPYVVLVLAVARPPHGSRDPVRPSTVLRELADRHRMSDRIYVYTQGRHDIAFYGARAGLRSWDQGERHYDEPRGYLREVDRLRGEPRVWFFWVRLDRDEPAWILSYLETIGHELERIPEREPGTTGAVLLDLSDPARLALASAENFPLSRSGTDR